MSKFPPLNTIPLYHSSLGALERPGEVNITLPYRKSDQPSQPGSEAKTRLFGLSARSLHAVFMSFAQELFDTPEIPHVLSECKRVLQTGGRIVVVGISKEGPAGPMVRFFEWVHRQFPQLLDCRPICVRRMLEDNGFEIETQAIRRMWIPVEIVLGIKAAQVS